MEPSEVTECHEEAMTRPRESVVSSPHCMVNFAASLPSITAWVRMARASSNMGSTGVTESHKAWVYQPKRHVKFTHYNARLKDEKICFPNISSLLDSLSGGALGKGLGLVLAGKA